MIAGGGDGLLTQTPYPVGDVICFEIAYDSLVNSSVRAGAQLLVVQTNNATFGHSGETYQQLAMSQLRAVEHDRTVVQVATSGKSAIIGPDGRIQQESGALFTPDILVRSIGLSTSTTVATRLGSVPEWVLTALGLLGLALALASGARRRRSGGPVDGDPLSQSQPVTRDTGRSGHQHTGDQGAGVLVTTTRATTVATEQ
jgi:apolipoprotein N-acyltransferase